MKREKLTEVIKKVYIIALFIIASFVVLLVLPREGKFRYEYKKGAPWLHENLVAPFPFVIYKSPAEIKAEKDSLAKAFKAYFKKDSSLAIEKMRKFDYYFDQHWDSTYARLVRNRVSNEYITYLANPANNKIDRLKYKKIIGNILEGIYKKGVIEPISELTEDNSVFIVENNIATEFDLNEVYTPFTGSKFLLQELKDCKELKRYPASQQIKIIEFVRSMGISQFVSPCILFDRQTSEKVKQGTIDGISSTTDLIKSDQPIIYKGEVVDDEKFKILESLKIEYQLKITESDNHFYILLGQCVVILSSMLILYLFLYNFRHEILKSPAKTSFILILVVAFIALAVLFMRSELTNIYLIPFSITPIMVLIFYDTRLALFVHLITIFIIGFFAPNGFEFVFIQFSAGIISIFSLKNLRKRAQLFSTVLLNFLITCTVYYGFSLVQETSIAKVNLDSFYWFAGNSILLLLAYPMVFLFEKTFGFLSDVTLIELTDVNNPLLRKLAEQAPGTFQHSLQVASMAEEVAYKIGGNPLLVRAGALYHDIGKMAMPQFFVENQFYGENPHDNLEYDKSAEIIIRHVEVGVEMARKYKLPEAVIDLIRTHHGTTKVLYFYRMFQNKYPDLEVDDKKFTYPGPCPFTKEMAILMMADTLEAASRSLKVVNEQTIAELVDRLVETQITDRQFDKCEITLQEISFAREVFKKKLANVYHNRIEYPKARKQVKKEAD